MKRLLTVLKGMCMGFADVIPGVSGGTMALILGIYVQFIEGIKSLNLTWLPPLFRWAGSGFSREKWPAFRDAWCTIHWGFLVPLGVGIVSAFAVGSKVVPDLMDRYPEGMRGFFMGLILASVVVPIRTMERRGARELAVGVLVGVLGFLSIGSHTEPALHWHQVSSDEALGLEDFTRAHPSIRTPEELYCPSADENDNAGLRAAIAQDPEQPGVSARLDDICAGLAARADSLADYVAYRDQIVNDMGERILERKHDDNPFNNVVVPAGTVMNVPTPSLWYIFVSGLLGICAMVLPGISGSFILLVLGVYHFMLSSALKGFVYALIDGHFPETQALFVVIFCAGCLIGILTFARVMSWLFHKHQSMTLAAMVGIMLGSLRAIWPFKLGNPHIGWENVMPDEPAMWAGPVVAFLIGFGLVAGITVAGVLASARRGESA